jgi:spermidine synthase
MENWFTETSNWNLHIQGSKYRAKLHEEQSKFQKIEVYDTYSYGKLLTLDGKTMVSEADEFIYHEVASHVPYMAHPNAKKVLIIGGGDGGVVREFVKHKDLTDIHLVEIDERVIEVSKKFFPEVASGLNDKRVKVLAKDGIEYMKKCKNEYDIIVVDSTDPEDFAEGLFTREFYKDVFNALKEDGIMVNQTESPFLEEFGQEKIYENLKSAFPIVKSYAAPMLIYPGVYWTFGFSSKKYRPTNIVSEKRNAMNTLQRSLKWYNMDWHVGSFAISNLHARRIGEL